MSIYSGFSADTMYAAGEVAGDQSANRQLGGIGNRQFTVGVRHRF